jgi:hypothetical protein
MFLISYFRQFDIPVIKCLDIPCHDPQNEAWLLYLFPLFLTDVTNGCDHSLIQNLHFAMLRFFISTFCYSCGEVFRHFKSRYPELRNGVRSTVWYSNVSHFGESAFRYSYGKVS